MISHFQGTDRSGSAFFFREDFLSEKAFQQIRALPIFSHEGQSIYELDAKQNLEVLHIFRKMKKEKKSGYAFSDSLQKTYLLELIHFLTKLHLQAPSFAPLALN
jgi:hypothetical protein